MIDGALEKIEANYVFPDVAKKMVAAIRARQEKKEYDSITNPREFAETLTKNLREVCKDKHLGVRYFSEPMPPDRTDGPSEAEMKKMRESMALRNFGFKKVERLGSGGVGLLELEGFMPADMVGDTAAAAMSFLANSDAVIVDLRKNGGGTPARSSCCAATSSMSPTHLNSIYTRTTDTTKQYWSLPVVPGKKLARQGRVRADERPDVLGGGGVRLQHAVAEARHDHRRDDRRRRASDARLPDQRALRIGVPFARSINPVTKTNWEGTGVKPDVAVPADQALLTAHQMALKKAADKYKSDKDKTPRSSADLETVNKELDALKAKAGESKQ